MRFNVIDADLQLIMTENANDQNKSLDIFKIAKLYDLKQSLSTSVNSFLINSYRSIIIISFIDSWIYGLMIILEK